MMPAATCPLSARDGAGMVIIAAAITPKANSDAGTLVMYFPSKFPGTRKVSPKWADTMAATFRDARRMSQW
jgi:hypothetical protein